MSCVRRGLEVPSCALTNPDPSRQIGLCTLAFGTDSTNAGAAPPAARATVSTSHPSTTVATDAAGPLSNASSSSPRSAGSREPESTSIPAPVCPGYQSEADENASAVDFPPADLPADTSEFRIVITHVDADCHIYGHALREGTTSVRGFQHFCSYVPLAELYSILHCQSKLKLVNN